MLDAKLIAAAIQSRAAWERIAPHFTADDFTPISKLWFGLVKEWYARDPDAKAIDKELLGEQMRKRITNQKHVDSTMGFLQDLPEAPSATNVAQVALEMKRYTVGMALGAAIGAQDQKRVDELLPLYTELKSATSLSGTKDKADVEKAVEWEELDEKVGKGNRIALAPQLLTERTNGGALPGHAVLIIGRSDSGKSTFTLNMTGGFIKQKKRTLYLGNEESIHVLKARMRNRLANMTPEEVEANPGLANQKARKVAGDLLEMYHLHKATINDVERAIKNEAPDVVVLDQIRGLSVANGEKMTQKLEQVAIEWRALLSKYAVVGVAVTQANDRTERYGQEPPIWLGQSDVDSSRTGLPGASDLILGVGVNQELRDRGQRAISIAKSKLSSARDAKEGFIVEMDVARCRVRS